jgi:hypothetical protein
MKPSLDFYRLRGPLNSCEHGQRQITKWWHADCKLVRMFSEPILNWNSRGKTFKYRTIRGRRFWVYTWFITFCIDILFSSKVKTMLKKNR